MVWNIAKGLLVKYWPAVVVPLIVGGGYAWWAHTQRAIGAERAMLELQHVQDSLAVAEAQHRVDTLRLAYRADTVRLVRYLVRLDTTKRAALAHLVDSLEHRTPQAIVDTLRVLIPARVVVAADSALLACRDVMQSCGQRFAAESLLADGWRRRALRPAPSVSWSVKAGHAAIAAGLGALLLAVLERVH